MLLILLLLQIKEFFEAVNLTQLGFFKNSIEVGLLQIDQMIIASQSNTEFLVVYGLWCHVLQTENSVELF